MREGGHEAVGLEGSARTCVLARSNSGCTLLKGDLRRVADLFANEPLFDGTAYTNTLFKLPPCFWARTSILINYSSSEKPRVKLDEYE